MFKRYNNNSAIRNHRTEFFLSLVVFPSNNDSIPIFSRRVLLNRSEVLHCNVCATYVQPSKLNVDQHMTGKKHISKIELLEKSAFWFKIEDVKDRSLVGLEYLLELHQVPNVPDSLYYVCMMCNIHGNFDEILGHYAANEHRVKFLVKHFPGLSNELKSKELSKDDNKKLVELLCDDVEKYASRLRPIVSLYSDFNRKPQSVWSHIRNGKHFDEKHYPDLVTLLNNSLIVYLKQLRIKKSTETIDLTSSPLSKKKRPNESPEKHEKPSVKKINECNKLPSDDREKGKKYLDSSQTFFDRLSDMDIRKIEMSIKITKELIMQKITPTLELVHRLTKLYQNTDNSSQDNRNEEVTSTSPCVSAKNYVISATNPSSLTSEELEFLLKNYETLNGDEQKDFLKYLQQLRS